MLNRTRFLRLIAAALLAGAASDIIARTLGQKLSESLGQPVVVENRPGVNGFIGLGAAAQAAPDGYTLVLGAATLVVSPALFKSVPFDPVAWWRAR